MRLSTSTNIHCFDEKKPYSISMNDSVTLCAEAGFQNLDANLCGHARRPGQGLYESTWETWAHEIRSLADSRNVRFTQAHAYYPVGHNGPQDDKAADEFGEELMRRSVLTAEILGAEYMVVHPLSIRTEPGLYDYRKSYDYNVEYWKKWAEFFHQHNVGMAIENMNCYSRERRNYCGNLDELLELIDAVGAPDVGCCIDTGHAFISGNNVPAMIRRAGKTLRATHIADNHGEKDEHIAPFAGSINWPEVMKALHDIDYAYDFSFEIHHLTSAYPACLQKDLICFAFHLGEYLMKL